MSAAVRWIMTGAATAGFTSLLLARSGRRDSGAGTLGTVVGFALLPLLPSGGAFVIVVCAAIPLSLIIIELSRQHLSAPDDPRIILDEVVGGWCAVALLPRTWPYLLAAFLLFRVFDIWKPGPIRASQDWPGSLGIVGDDVLAGMLACGLLHATRFVLSWV